MIKYKYIIILPTLFSTLVATALTNTNNLLYFVWADQRVQ